MSDYGIKMHIATYHWHHLSFQSIESRFVTWCKNAEIDVDERDWQTFHDQFLHFVNPILGYTPHEHGHLPVIGNELDVWGEPTGKIIPIKPPRIPIERYSDGKPIEYWTVTEDWIEPQWVGDHRKRYIWRCESLKFEMFGSDEMVPQSRAARLGVYPQPTVWDIR